MSVPRLQHIAAALRLTPARVLSAPEPLGSDTSERAASTPLPEQSWRAFPPLPLDPVLAGAIECFVELGYHATSMRTLAARIGVGVSSIYHHYADKQQLLVRALDITMAEIQWRVDAARAEAHSSRDEVALMVEALALFHTHHRDLAFIGATEMRSLEPSNRQRIKRSRNAVQYALDDAIDQAMLDGRLRSANPRAAGRAIAAMCTSLPQWFHAGGSLTPEDIAREYTGFALSMLGDGPSSPDESR